MQERNAQKARVRQIMAFVALFYAVDGLAQPGGLISQPLTFFLKESLGWSADHVAQFLSAMVFPLIITPAYGLISDAFPLFGYHRKSYILLAAVIAAGAYGVLTMVTGPTAIFCSLLGVAIGMAIGNTLCSAVMVQNGKELGLSGTFINQQWLWFNVAAVVVSAFAGWLTNHFSPGTAFHTAACIAMFSPLAIALGCTYFLQEPAEAATKDGVVKSLSGVWAALRSRNIWLVAGFLFTYNFSPGLGTPLFYHMTDHLHFQQSYIGLLGSFSAVGNICGALLYTQLQKKLYLRTLLKMSIILGAIGQLSYLFLSGETSAAVLAFFNGGIGIVMLVSSLALAASACPDKAEGFTYALLTSLATLTYMFSTNMGAILYERVLHHSINPLILISAGCTLTALAFLPLLKLGDLRAQKPQS